MGRKKKTSHSNGIIIHISSDEVAEALALANKGRQQIKPLETNHPTRFYFSVEYNGHYSACEIRVSPFPVRRHENVHFFPEQRYILCCKHASEENLKQLRQTVYNVLIHPVQWQFNTKSDVVEFLASTHATSCKARISEGIDFLQQNEPESTDITKIAKCVSEKVLKAIRETERSTFVCQKYLKFGDNKTDDARMQLADKLWSLAKMQREGFETILWANKFYALCMRFILRTSQALQTDRYLDRAAKTAVLINSIASEFCFVSPNKVCVCDANIVYNGFAKANCLLPDIPGSDVGRSSVVSKIVDALRGNMVPLPGAQFIFHAPAVISYLWDEDYSTVCKQLGAESLAQHDLSKVVERIGNTDLYTYAVRCACSCGHSAATGAYRDRGNFAIAGQEDGSIISDAGQDSSCTSIVPCFPSMAQRTFVGDFEQVSLANVNKRPAIQQQSNDATKRQRAVMDYPKSTPDDVTSNPGQRDISGSPDDAGNSSDIVRDDQAEGDMAETMNNAHGPDTHTNSDRVHDDCGKAAQPTQDLEGDLDQSFTTFLMREMTENFGLDGGGALFNLHNWEHELLQGSFHETRYH